MSAATPPALGGTRDGGRCSAPTRWTCCRPTRSARSSRSACARSSTFAGPPRPSSGRACSPRPITSATGRSAPPGRRHAVRRAARDIPPHVRRPRRLAGRGRAGADRGGRPTRRHRLRRGQGPDRRDDRAGACRGRCPARRHRRGLHADPRALRGSGRRPAAHRLAARPARAGLPSGVHRRHARAPRPAPWRRPGVPSP